MPRRSDPDPPKPRYKLTLTITGNTLDEIAHELVAQSRGGFLIDSDYYTRDEWTVYGGRVTSRMEHVNPEMTPERYAAELNEWSGLRKAAKGGGTDG